MKSKYLKLKKKQIHQQKPKKEKIFNYGLAILKVIMAFLVVNSHNCRTNTTKNKIILYITKERLLHVPSFFIMSFYFMNKNLLSLNPKIILNRIMRLLIPYFIWPTIIWKINHFYNKKYKTKFEETYLDLKLQLLWGHHYTPQFWFLWNLTAITILFTIIIFIFRKHSVFILQIVLIFFYVTQYSGYHYHIFIRNPFYKRNTLGFFFESVPYAVNGFTLGYYKAIDLIQKCKIKTFILSIVIYKLLADYNIFTNIRGVFYKGIKFNIQATCLIFIFSLFPSDKIKNKYIKKFLTLITNYTAGVYYLHLALRRYLGFYFDDVKKRKFRGLFITYFVCYIISFIGMLIFGKTPLKYLFC